MTQAYDFQKNKNGLIQFQAEERFGFAFVCLKKDSPDLDTWLGNFFKFHEGWPLSDLKSIRRREIVVNCTWKKFLEVVGEC